MAPRSSPSCGAASGSCWHRSLLCPLLAYVAITQLTPRYTATGTLLYDASEYKVRELQSILRVDPITDAVMASQAEVLRGMPVIEQVANRLNLLTQPGIQRIAAAASWPERCAGLIGRCVRSRAGSRRRPAWTAAGSCAQCHAERRAGRTDRHTGEGIARAGGLVHRGRSGHRRGRRQQRDGRLREGAAWREIRRGRQGARVAGAAARRIAHGMCGEKRMPSPDTAPRTAWSRACMRGSEANRSAC